MKTLTRQELNRATLARQFLLAREQTTALRAIERLFGLQAQVAKPPFIGLWSRVEGFGREDLINLLRKRKAVRATMMRGTLHLTSAKDFLEFRATMQPMLTAALRDHSNSFVIDEVVAAARSHFKKQPCSFNDLRAYLVKQFPKGEERAMGYAVRMQLPLIQVPEDLPWAFPAQADFADAASWLGKSPAATEKPEQLALRYLAAFGPASAKDVVTWSGLNAAAAALQGLRKQLEVFADERGRELFDLPDAPRPRADTPVPVRFLPEFDNLVLSHADRTRIVSDEHRPAIISKNLQVRATFLVGGFVAGTWKTERKKKAATLLIEPFAKLNAQTRGELTAEGLELLRFAEPDAENFEVIFRQNT